MNETTGTTTKSRHEGNIAKLEELLHGMETDLDGVHAEGASTLRDECEEASELVLSCLAMLGAMDRDRPQGTDELKSVCVELEALVDAYNGTLAAEIDEGHQHEDGYRGWGERKEAALELARHLSNDVVAGFAKQLDELAMMVREAQKLGDFLTQKLEHELEQGRISEEAANRDDTEMLLSHLSDAAGDLYQAVEQMDGVCFGMEALGILP